MILSRSRVTSHSYLKSLVIGRSGKGRDETQPEMFHRLVLRATLSSSCTRTTQLTQCNVTKFSRVVTMSDDFTALLGGMGKFKLNRRMLSVVCDEESESRGEDGVTSTTDLHKDLRQVIQFKERGGKVSPIKVEKTVRDLCTAYNDAAVGDKFKFLEDLAENFSTDKANVNLAASSLLASNEEQERSTLETQLQNSLVPDYHWIFQQIGKLDNGVKFLVDLRSDIIDLAKTNKSHNIANMNDNLRELIRLWFSVGFLMVERITWSSPGSMLKKISEYEAVHPVKNMTDLKRRLGPYRRCFVFTHRSMPGEPIVVLHVFLTRDIPGRISTIVRSSQGISVDSNNEMEHVVEDSSLCEAAIFYSITSTQKGLLGIELGNFLIKRVVKELQSEFPKMKRFSSLSPILFFKKWLVASIKKGEKVLTEEEEEELTELWEIDPTELNSRFLQVLDADTYVHNESLCSKMEKILMRLCAVYLVQTKSRGYAYDPVAHFHLKNGAVLWRINWLADLSPKGLSQSCGIMVNYRYFIKDCDKNSEDYFANQRLITSDAVQNLLK